MTPNNLPNKGIITLMGHVSMQAGCLVKNLGGITVLSRSNNKIIHTFVERNEFTDLFRENGGSMISLF